MHGSLSFSQKSTVCCKLILPPTLNLQSQRMAARPTMRPLLMQASRSAAPGLNATARRSLTTAHRPANIQLPCALIRPTLSKPFLQHSFRRSYADLKIPPKTKRRGRGFFRWTWRLTYLSAIGGLGYLAYNIYTLRTPTEQLEADSTKKTLVILGIRVPSKLN